MGMAECCAVIYPEKSNYRYLPVIEQCTNTDRIADSGTEVGIRNDAESTKQLGTVDV